MHFLHTTLKLAIINKGDHLNKIFHHKQIILKTAVKKWFYIKKSYIVLHTTHKITAQISGNSIEIRFLYVEFFDILRFGLVYGV